MFDRRSCAAALIVVLAAGPTLAGQADAETVGKALAAHRAALLEPLRSMEGTWEMIDDKNQVVGESRFEVTANGSAVRETLFPGQAHEMTNMYHLDGDALVMTHYCAGGNQPRMRTQGQQDDAIAFDFESVTNLASKDESYMGAMVFKRIDAGTASQTWTSFAGDQRSSWTFRMKRKNP